MKFFLTLGAGLILIFVIILEGKTSVLKEEMGISLQINFYVTLLL